MVEIQFGLFGERVGGNFCKILEKLDWDLIYVEKWYLFDIGLMEYVEFMMFDVNFGGLD